MAIPAGQHISISHLKRKENEKRLKNPSFQQQKNLPFIEKCLNFSLENTNENSNVFIFVKIPKGKKKASIFEKFLKKQLLKKVKLGQRKGVLSE